MGTRANEVTEAGGVFRQVVVFRLQRTLRCCGLGEDQSEPGALRRVLRAEDAPPPADRSPSVPLRLGVQGWQAHGCLCLALQKAHYTSTPKQTL